MPWVGAGQAGPSLPRTSWDHSSPGLAGATLQESSRLQEGLRLGAFTGEGAATSTD